MIFLISLNDDFLYTKPYVQSNQGSGDNMPVTNEEIMEKLDKIETLLVKMAGQQEKIEKEEEKELSELDETVGLEFPNVEDWRKEMWENCPHKEERSADDEVDFWCKAQDKACRFEGCPENKKV